MDIFVLSLKKVYKKTGVFLLPRLRVSKKSTLSRTEIPLAENQNGFSDCAPLPPVPPTPLENRLN